MRLLHISDIHIGVELYGRRATEADIEALPPYFAPGEDRTQYLGINTRLLDFLSAMDYAVDYAATHGVDLVLFAGDAYKSRDPSQTHQREFARRIARLSEVGIPTFLTVGNHDLAPRRESRHRARHLPDAQRPERQRRNHARHSSHLHERRRHPGRGAPVDTHRPVHGA